LGSALAGERSMGAFSTMRRWRRFQLRRARAIGGDQVSQFTLSLRSMSARLFGLNVIAENEFNAFFDSWFSSLNRPIV
jgi:hypothetical protein